MSDVRHQATPPSSLIPALPDGVPHGIALIIASHIDGSDAQVVATYDYERTATLYARDYVAKGYRAWLQEGRVRWEITKAETLCL